MQKFYKKALIVSLCLMLLTAILAYAFITRTYNQISLASSSDHGFHWGLGTSTDSYQGGSSVIKLRDDRVNLSFDFTITRDASYPFAGAEIIFRDNENQNTLIDLAPYNTLTFKTKCSPANTLSIAVLTFDESVSKVGDYLTYRNVSGFFSCNENWTSVTIDLTRLEAPQWWFDMFGIELSNVEYALDKVARIGFGSTFQSPLNIDSTVMIDEISLMGRDWTHVYAFVFIVLLLWGIYAMWFLQQHTRALVEYLQSKVSEDSPLISYQQLHIQPHKEREKVAILEFMAVEYCSPELNLDLLVSKTGINKNKINDILKAELGCTFISYLNKLRLTEAARLLIHEEVSIGDIGFAVGYKNTSYFNKLFKQEYKCTPKTFKALHRNNLSSIVQNT